MPTSTVRYIIDGIERPGSFDLQGGERVYAEETVTDSEGNTRTFTSNTITVGYSALPAGYTAPQDYGVDWGLSYWWDNPALQIFLLNYGVGPNSIGDPTRVIRSTTDRSVTLTAGEGPLTGGKTWRTGAMQIVRQKIAPIGSFGAIIHAHQPNAVCALFGYKKVMSADGTRTLAEKEADFELTKVGSALGWAPNVHLVDANGNRRTPNSSRPKARAPWADRPQKLFARQMTNPHRWEFFCDDVLFETLTPADYASDVIWDTTTAMDTFLSVEKHGSWAGWTQADYDKGAAMTVYAARPGPNL